jgi:hypothetical protein
MLDIGFLPDLQRILSYLPKQRQTLLFSATFSPEIRRLAESYLQDPILVEVARPNATASKVEQHFYSVSTDDKRRAVLKLLKERSITQALVFVNSKLGCARLARSFERDGLRTDRAARRQVAGRAAEGARGVQEGRGRRPGRDRRRGARPRHRRPAGGLQLRRAVQRRGLRPPHRPHRARRRFGAGDHAGLARRLAPRRRHREAARQEDRARAARARRAAAAALPRARPSRRRRVERRQRRHPRRARVARAALGAAVARPGREPPRSIDPFFDKPTSAGDGVRAGVGAARRAGRARPLAEHQAEEERSPPCSAARIPEAAET